MLLLAAALLIAEPAAFPERVPSMIQACLLDAVAHRATSKTEESYKYICTGKPADDLWTFLEQAKLESWEQDVAKEGR